MTFSFSAGSVGFSKRRVVIGCFTCDPVQRQEFCHSQSLPRTWNMTSIRVFVASGCCLCAHYRGENVFTALTLSHVLVRSLLFAQEQGGVACEALKLSSEDGINTADVSP